jgi:Phycobilisome protein
MTAQLSEHVKELITKARIVNLATWQASHPAPAIALVQAADDQGRYLSDADLQQLQTLVPDRSSTLAIVQQLRDQVADIVDDARASVLTAFPGITEPGGSLYPAVRSEACWRDFWHFLRCITYGIAGQHTDYLSPEGLYYMRLLYAELQVPLDAMVVGLEGIKTASLKRLVPEQQVALSPYFDHLIDRVSSFRS